jgi:hypothetical protein
VLVKDRPARPGFTVALVHAESGEVNSGRDLDAYVVLLRREDASSERELDFARYELKPLDASRHRTRASLSALHTRQSIIQSLTLGAQTEHATAFEVATPLEAFRGGDG